MTAVQKGSKIECPIRLHWGPQEALLSALCLTVLRHFAFHEPIPPLPLNLDCVCPSLGKELDQPGVQFFFSGLLVGILLGPAIDLLWLVRERWRRLVLANLHGGARGGKQPLFRVVNE